MLRGLAALVVVVSHYSNLTNILSAALGGGAGEIGVMIFFVLSGFLMSYLYMEKEFTRTHTFQFVIARIARVIPLFVVVVIISYLLTSIGRPNILYDISNRNILLANLLFLSGTSVLWTIPTEVQFYILFIGLWWLYSRKKGYLFGVMTVIFILLIILGFPKPGIKLYGIHFQETLIGSLQYFFAGIVFGLLYRAWQAPSGLKKNFNVLALLLILLIYPNIFKLIFGFDHNMWKDVGVLFVVAAVFFVIVFLVPDNNKILSNRVGDFLGMISYSIYMLHFPILGWISVYAVKQPGWFFLVYLAIVLSISFLSYTLIENPARNAIRLLSPRERSQTGDTSGVLPAKG
jgi:peptidoglycan/LPS O-acetylase OafA/YrhL